MLKLGRYWRNLVPRAFPSKNGWPAPPIFQGKSPGDEVGIDAEKLYGAIFICQYGLCCCRGPSFLFDCFVKIWATCKFWGGKWFTAPLAKNSPYAYVNAFTCNLITHVHQGSCKKKLQPFFKDFSRSTYQEYNLTENCTKMYIPSLSIKTLRLELFASPTSLHFSFHWSKT